VTAVTGFGLTLDDSGEFSISLIVSGRVYGANLAGRTPAYLTTVVGDMQTAYADAAGRVNPSYIDLSRGNLNGLTLEPGLYKWNGNVGFTNQVTFDGSADSVWILQITGNLYVGSGAESS